MRIFKIGVFFILLAIFSGTLFSQQTELTLRRVISEAFKNNTTIIKAQEQIISQEYIIKASYNDILPSLSFTGGWTRSNQVSTGTTIINGVPLDLGNRNTTTNNFNLSLRSDITLFNGFSNYDKVQAAKLTRIRYISLLEKTKQDIVFKLLQD